MKLWGEKSHWFLLSPQSFLLLCIRVYWRIYGSYFGVHFSLLYTWIRSPGALAIFATKQRYHLPLFSFSSWLVSLSLWETWKSFSTSASLIHFRQNVISSTASLQLKIHWCMLNELILNEIESDSVGWLMISSYKCHFTQKMPKPFKKFNRKPWLLFKIHTLL